METRRRIQKAINKVVEDKHKLCFLPPKRAAAIAEMDDNFNCLIEAYEDRREEAVDIIHNMDMVNRQRLIECLLSVTNVNIKVVTTEYVVSFVAWVNLLYDLYYDEYDVVDTPKPEEIQEAYSIIN